MTALNQIPPQKCMVEHFDSILRFMVRSRGTSGATYLVDLGDARYPNGSCTCRHFITTIGPAQLRGEDRCCWHMEMARWHFMKWALDVFRAHELKRNPDPDAPPAPDPA